MAIQSDQEFVPSRIARATFPTAFRGYDQDAVRRYLSRLAAELEQQAEYADLGDLEARTPAHNRVEELEVEIENLNEEIRDLEVELVQRSLSDDDELADNRKGDGSNPGDSVDRAGSPLSDEALDESRAIEFLGQETARVLESARSAASDILKRAEGQAKAMERQATEHLADARARAEALVADKQAKIEALVEKLESEAEFESSKMKADAEQHHAMVLEESAKMMLEAETSGEAEREKAQERAREIVADAETLRQQVVSELVAERRSARQELEQMGAARDRVAMSLSVARTELDAIASDLERSSLSALQPVLNPDLAVGPASKTEPVAADEEPTTETPIEELAELAAKGEIDLDTPLDDEDITSLFDADDTQEAATQQDELASNKSDTRTAGKSKTKSSKKSGTKSESKSASKSGAKSESKSGAKSASKSGAKSESKSGAKSGAKSASKPANKSANRTPASNKKRNAAEAKVSSNGARAKVHSKDEAATSSSIDSPEGFDTGRDEFDQLRNDLLSETESARLNSEPNNEPNNELNNEPNSELASEPGSPKIKVDQAMTMVDGFTTIDLADETIDLDLFDVDDTGADHGSAGDVEHSVIVSEPQSPDSVITTVAARSTTALFDGNRGDIELDEPGPGKAPAVFSARDVALTRSGADFRRQLRRALNDDQSDVLDRLRAGRGSIKTSELPAFGDQIDRYLTPLRRSLGEVAQAGVASGGDGELSPRALDNLVRQLAKFVVDQVRIPTVEAVTTAEDQDREKILEPIRAIYRDFRNGALPGLAEDALYEAFAIGLYDSIEPAERLTWLIDPRTDPDPVCEINAANSDVVKGAIFPSGHSRPLAMPGCRCLVVSADF